MKLRLVLWRGPWRRRPSLGGGRGWKWGGGFGFLAVAGWELVEEEAVAGDEGGLVFGGPCAGVGKAGGVLDAEAHFVEGVGSEVAGFGEAFFLVLGGFVLGIAAI